MLDEFVPIHVNTPKAFPDEIHALPQPYAPSLGRRFEKLSLPVNQAPPKLNFQPFHSLKQPQNGLGEKCANRRGVVPLESEQGKVDASTRHPLASTQRETLLPTDAKRYSPAK